jgi:hypothetical protein
MLEGSEKLAELLKKIKICGDEENVNYFFAIFPDD